MLCNMLVWMSRAVGHLQPYESEQFTKLLARHDAKNGVRSLRSLRERHEGARITIAVAVISVISCFARKDSYKVTNTLVLLPCPYFILRHCWSELRLKLR